MAVTLRREDAALTLSNERVRVRLELTPLALSVATADGSVGIAGARAAAELAGARVEATLVRDLAIEEDVDTPLGRALRVRALAAAREGLELRLVVELGSDWPGPVVALECRNAGAAPRVVTALEPLAWAPGTGARLDLPGTPEEVRFLALGHQSWSPARWLGLGERPQVPRRELGRRLYASPFAPVPARGRFVSESATALGAPGRPGLALGFTSHGRWLSWLELASGRGQISRLAARSALEDQALAPGGSVASERLFVGVAAPVESALALWAERAGREMAAPVPARSPSGWCSWYRFGTRITAADVRRNLRALRELRAPLDVVQIDDGFQSLVGDWLAPADGFPDGLAPLAREIRAEGFRAGLWLAPFIVSRRARLAREKPEWLLRDARGKLLTALWNPAWKGKRCFALDATHPGVEAWLEALGREVRALGFDYLKLDFLFAGALAGKRHDAGASCVQAYRRGLAALRRGAGPGVFVVGCGAPLGASIGLVEAMRIGPDVEGRWTNPLFDALLGVEAAPAARNSLANVFARAPLHQRLWLNDPDCALLRPTTPRKRSEPMSGSKLSEAESLTLAAAVAVSGGLAIVSDELAELPPARIAWLRRMLPALSRVPEVGPARGGLPEELVTRFDDGSALYLRANLGEQDVRVELDLAALGFAGRTRVWDVLAERELPRASGRLKLGVIEPHASRLLRLVPDPSDGRARLVGSSLHFAAGALEAESVALEAPGVARVRLRLAGHREGEIALALPRTRDLVRAQVAFDDTLELRIHAAGVVNPPGISD